MNRCEFKWRNIHGTILRCMLDEGHPEIDGHRHGIEVCFFTKPHVLPNS